MAVNLQVGGCIHEALLPFKNCLSTSVLSVVIHKAVNLQVEEPCTQSSTHSQELPLILRPFGRRQHNGGQPSGRKLSSPSSYLVCWSSFHEGGQPTGRRPAYSSTHYQKLPLNLCPFGRRPLVAQVSFLHRTHYVKKDDVTARSTVYGRLITRLEKALIF
jgi:hypothetical protein